MLSFILDPAADVDVCVDDAVSLTIAFPSSRTLDPSVSLVVIIDGSEEAVVGIRIVLSSITS